jgi:hypothetical protein
MFQPIMPVTSELFKNIHVSPVLIANNDLSQSEIKTCELLFGIECSNLPLDYKQFIYQFGEGILGDYIRIFPLWRLCQATANWREGENSCAEKEFFNNDNKNESLLVGDTLDGDLIFYLNDKFYLAARQYESKVYTLGQNLNDVFDFFKHDINYGDIDVTDFKPFNSNLSR